jgi:hypothetical protein
MCHHDRAMASLCLLPTDIHSVIYSYLQSGEKLRFISLSKEIFLTSRYFRELKLKARFSQNYLFKKPFRERILKLVGPSQIMLNLSECDRVTNQHLSLPFVNGVHSLNLTECPIDDEGVRHLGNVQILTLRGCSQITDQSLPFLSHVHTLDLAYCDRITDEGVACLGNVHNLDLSICTQITDKSLPFLCNVHSLSLMACPFITDEGVLSLTNVRVLDLSSCWRVTDEGVRHLVHARTLIISACIYITEEGVAHLRQAGVDIIMQPN